MELSRKAWKIFFDKLQKWSETDKNIHFTMEKMKQWSVSELQTILSLGRHKLLRRMFCYPDSPVLHYIKTRLMRKCLWRKQWHQSCKHLQDTWNTLIFWARWQNVLHRLQFKSNKKKHWLSKGQKHLEIILLSGTAYRTEKEVSQWRVIILKISLVSPDIYVHETLQTAAKTCFLRWTSFKILFLSLKHPL